MGVRTQAIQAIIRKDMAVLGPFIIAGALVELAVSALFHTQADFPDIPILGVILSGLVIVGVPVALMILVILLIQNDVATDTRHDWLTRPVAPVEMVAAKAALIAAAIVAPTVLGDLAYAAIRGAPLAVALVPVGPMLTCCIFVTVVAWLVSTPLRVFLVMLGMIVVLSVIAAIVVAWKVALYYANAAAAGLVNPPPPVFPPAGAAAAPTNLVFDLAWLAILLAVSGVCLWLLLARRRPVPARWIMIVYFIVSMFILGPLSSSVPTPAPKQASLSSHMTMASRISNTSQEASIPPIAQRP